MKPRFQEYYEREENYVSESFRDFAVDHPKIAARLGARAGDAQDSYAQRLLQAFAFASARSQMRIDDWTLDLPLRELEAVNPNFVAPLPSLAVARFYPDAQAAHSPQGLLLPRGTRLTTHATDKGATAEFRTAQPVRVWPLRIDRVRSTGIPADIPSLHRFVEGSQDVAVVRGALRIRLATINGARLSSLAALDRLPVYLCGEERLASRLFELIHTSVIGMVMGAPDRFESGDLYGAKLPGLPHMTVSYEGLNPDESLLRPISPKFHGQMLVHEFFALPARFWFFALNGLGPGLRKIDGPEVEIVLLLSREVNVFEEHIDASQFALFCSPVANLFPTRTARLDLATQAAEPIITPVAGAPDDFEVHSVDLVLGQVDKDSGPVAFRPLDVPFADDSARHPRFFTLRRELEAVVDHERRYDTRQQFVRTRTRLKLLGPDLQPDDIGIQYVTLEAWLTNGDLPCIVPRNGVNDLIAKDAKSVATVGFVRAPTAPRAPLAFDAGSDAAWDLLRQLHIELQAFDDEFDEKDPGEGLRSMLRPFLGAGDPTMARCLESLVGASVRPVYDMHRCGGELELSRGIEVTLTFDEEDEGDWLPFTFALALERYVARHVSAHAFTRTVMRTVQRGVVFTWPTRAGTRGIF
ncbi:type VI secretion system baseplate subunit TssF [Caballeronia sp. LZ019]|uniref:type VI secretion system baseplate subunit TssF n=1 Tax=Caballeronia sp. LZ019 TaxID=3038555 RepID=UPI00285E4051|nr:type VI secretion system baseplate subunit TssF [Caballeronia sp. LZ019]MDR5808724.1 type VI secretion system baseplate subunit TssF [Caballeronia sp. LZ019]